MTTGMDVIASLRRLNQLAGALDEARVERLGPVQRADLAAALSLVRALLDPEPGGAFAIRTFRIGDMPMIAARQSVLYDESHGWGRGLEANACAVIAAFLRNFKAGREQAWIAEVDGAPAGSVLLTDEGGGMSRLRLLYVEPFARGRGIGDRLVETCIAFARHAGYTAMTLWTHTVLESARRIYAAHGFVLVATEVHETFGTPVQGETWLLDLARIRTPPAG
jgi:GNAT superfamily N-acetyltransferase